MIAISAYTAGMGAYSQEQPSAETIPAPSLPAQPAQIAPPVQPAPVAQPVPSVQPAQQMQPTPQSKSASSAAVKQKPAVPTEIIIESKVAQALSSLALDGWTGRPLEIFPRKVDPMGDAGADAMPANKLFGLDDQTYSILAEFKVRKCYKRTFQRGQRFLQAAAYFFATPDGAYGAYNFMRQGAATTIVTGSGSSEDDLSISFWKGNCFVRLTQTSEQDEESKEALRVISKTIDATIPPYTFAPLVLNQLPVLDRVRGSEKLIMGPNSGRRFFAAPYIADLSLDRARAAVTADYRFQLPPERLKLLVVDYANPNLAESVYQNYRRNLDADHDMKDLDDAGTPAGIVKLGNGFMLVQLRGTRIFVVMNARKKVSPMMLARQIP